MAAPSRHSKQDRNSFRTASENAKLHIENNYLLLPTSLQPSLQDFRLYCMRSLRDDDFSSQG